MYCFSPIGWTLQNLRGPGPGRPVSTHESHESCCLWSVLRTCGLTRGTHFTQCEARRSRFFHSVSQCRSFVPPPTTKRRLMIYEVIIALCPLNNYSPLLLLLLSPHLHAIPLHSPDPIVLRDIERGVTEGRREERRIGRRERTEMMIIVAAA